MKCSKKMGNIDLRKLTMKFVNFFLEKGGKSISKFTQVDVYRVFYEVDNQLT